MPRRAVYMLPDYRPHNPYQQLLADALAEHAVDVTFPRGYRLGLPLRRGLAADLKAPRQALLHLHWPEAYVTARAGLPAWTQTLRFWLDLALARRAVRGLVWTLHNLRPHESSGDGAERLLYHRIAACADAIIVHGADLRQRTVEAFGIARAKVHVIPQAPYTESYGALPPKAQARDQLGLDKDQTVFLFVGMLRPYKGLERLLEAWRGAALDGAMLLIAGAASDPHYQSALEAQARGLANVTIDPRFIPDARMTTYLSAADACVFPFERSSNSGSVHLALGYQLPVVVPALAAITETVGERYPLLYEPGSTQGLVAALQRAAGMTGSEAVWSSDPQVSSWTWTDVALATAGVYSTL